jgi:hypothetical protein
MESQIIKPQVKITALLSFCIIIGLFYIKTFFRTRSGAGLEGKTHSILDFIGIFSDRCDNV